MRPLTAEELARPRAELRSARLKIAIVIAAAGIFFYFLFSSMPVHLDLGLLVLVLLAFVVLGLFIESLAHLHAIKDDLSIGVVETTAGPVTRRWPGSKYTRPGVEVAGKAFNLPPAVVGQVKVGDDMAIHWLPHTRLIVKAEHQGQDVDVKSPFSSVWSWR